MYEGNLILSLNAVSYCLIVYREEVKSGVISEVIWDKNLFVGVKGVKFVLETGENLVSSKRAGIYAVDPAGDSRIWLADEIRGSRLVYYVREGDIDMSGIWQIQSFADFGNWKAFGERIIIPVEENLL